MVRAGLVQDPEAMRLFNQFAWEHPEVVDKSTFFCSRIASFDLEVELTAVYGASYKRTYSTWGACDVTAVTPRYTIRYSRYST